MTKAEVLRMISDTVTELDRLIGLPPRSNADRRLLLDLRILLGDRQRSLSRKMFSDNTASFQQIAADLAAIDGDIRKTLNRVDQIDTTIDNVTRFMNALTRALTIIAVVA